MGQAKQICPICDRKPGTAHDMDCERGQEVQAAVKTRAAIAGRPRKVYPGKGDLIATFEDAEGERHFLKNRGLPYVNVAKNGKSPFAGGMPSENGKKLTEKELMEEVEFFNAGIAAESARVDAQREAEMKALSSELEGETYQQELLDEASGLNLPPSVLKGAREAAIEKNQAITLIRDGQAFSFDPEGNVTKASVEATD